MNIDRGYVMKLHLLVVKPRWIKLNDNGIIFAAKQVKQSFYETIKKLGLLNFEQAHVDTFFIYYGSIG